MAVKKKRTNPFLDYPTKYEKHGYFAPTEQELDEGAEKERSEEVSKMVPVLDRKSDGRELQDTKKYLFGEELQKERRDDHDDEMARQMMELNEVPSETADVATVKKFQSENGLSADGIIGPKTKSKLKELGYDTVGEWAESIPSETTAAAETAVESQSSAPETEAETKKESVPEYSGFVGLAQRLANPDSFAQQMMDMEKPAEYGTAYDRYRSADRLGRRIAPFADSGFGKNIYANAMQRAQMENGRANTGEQNVLQRRTTAENMWGHYSPAITQALTNSAVFTQRAYQAQEESNKLEQDAKIAEVKLQQLEANLKNRFEQSKLTWLGGGRVSWDDFKKISETGEGQSKIYFKNASKDYVGLMADAQALVLQNAEVDRMKAEAAKQHNVSVQAQTIADANNKFASDSHRFWGFPTLDLAGVLKQKQLKEQGGEKTAYGRLHEDETVPQGQPVSETVTVAQTPTATVTTKKVQTKPAASAATATKTQAMGSYGFDPSNTDKALMDLAKQWDSANFVVDGKTVPFISNAANMAEKYRKATAYQSVRANKLDADQATKDAYDGNMNSAQQIANNIGNSSDVQNNWMTYAFNVGRHQGGIMTEYFKVIPPKWSLFTSDAIKNVLDKSNASVESKQLFERALSAIENSTNSEDTENAVKTLNSAAKSITGGVFPTTNTGTDDNHQYFETYLDKGKVQVAYVPKGYHLQVVKVNGNDTVQMLPGEQK